MKEIVDEVQTDKKSKEIPTVSPIDWVNERYNENINIVKPEKNKLEKSIREWRNERYLAQKHWSFVHHFSLFGSIVSSVMAGALMQATNNQTLPSILTSIAAVLTGIAASGGFERRWRSNRLSRSVADRMLVDIESDNPNIENIIKRYKVAIEKHDAEEVCETNENHQKGY